MVPLGLFHGKYILLDSETRPSPRFLDTRFCTLPSLYGYLH